MNQRLYDSIIPPEIDISSVKDLNIPTVIFYGKQDTIVYAQDSLWLRNQLGPVVKGFHELEGGHLQYFIRSDASYLETVMDYFDEFN